jgi:hypothetical protein
MDCSAGENNNCGGIACENNNCGGSACENNNCGGSACENNNYGGSAGENNASVNGNISTGSALDELPKQSEIDKIKKTNFARVELTKAMYDLIEQTKELRFMHTGLFDCTSPSERLGYPPDLPESEHKDYYKFLVEKRGDVVSKGDASTAIDLDGFIYLFSFGKDKAHEIFDKKQYRNSQICAYLLNKGLVNLSRVDIDSDVLKVYLQAGVGELLRKYPKVLEFSKQAMPYHRRNASLRPLLDIVTTEKNIIQLIIDFLEYELEPGTFIDYNALNVELREINIKIRQEYFHGHGYDSDDANSDVDSHDVLAW